MSPFENLSWRLWRVWRRNLLVYMRTWKVNFIPPLAEPALYILAFGAGLGSMVGAVRVHIFPASHLQLNKQFHIFLRQLS